MIEIIVISEFNLYDRSSEWEWTKHERNYTDVSITVKGARMQVDLAKKSEAVGGTSGGGRGLATT